MKLRFTLLALLVAMVAGGAPVAAQTSSYDTVLTALKTIDPEILQYFPRWKICEPDLQVQIVQTFALMGYRRENLDGGNIVVTSAPLKENEEPVYELILIECGSERMVASEIASYMKKLSYRIARPERPYCYQDIPPSSPPSAPLIAEIINYMEPTNVTHAFTLSAFEQSLKIGKSGFWIKSSLGTDQVGYHYWSSGEGRVALQRPLYPNTDMESRRAIPYLINARLGFGYRLTGGIDGGKKLLEFIPGRQLNAGYGGKFVGALDFHMPFHPRAGVGVNIELPMQSIDPATSVDGTTYFSMPIGNRRITAPSYNVDPYGTAAILRSTGQVTLFYNWWLDPKVPENFFRFDVGVSYAEVREAAIFHDTMEGGREYLGINGVSGLRTWKPDEFKDWIYAKIEYRNQNAFPFGVGVQVSNQILLGRVYLPIFGDWLYVEGRYSTPLRTTRPFEIRNFFMISPVLRLNF